jgi:hypothetical protein
VVDLDGAMIVTITTDRRVPVMVLFLAVTTYFYCTSTVSER